MITWKIKSISTLNYTQSITIQDDGNNTNTTIEVDNDCLLYLHKLDNPSICVDYNITLNVDTNITSCSDSRTTSMYKTGNQSIIKDNTNVIYY